MSDQIAFASTPAQTAAMTAGQHNLKVLLVRAAEALTYTRSCWGWLKETPAIDDLITELRKTAE